MPDRGTQAAVDDRPLLRLRDVMRTYRMGAAEINALAGVSVEFGAGEFCAVMGASGSGKSTLLHVLGCLDRPTSGTYTLAGQDVGGLNDREMSRVRLERIGFIFQSFNLIPQLTVLRNIELPLYYLGCEAAESAERAAGLARRVGLGERLNHRPSELSGGQQQRVAIARSLANDPVILLADEPTGNLDTATGNEIMDLLRELNGQGKTIIMVTHEDEVAAHARRRLHMRDGRIVRIEEDEGR